MTLSLTGETNKSYFAVNGVIFHMKSGEEIIVGWDSVSYFIDNDGKIEANFQPLCIWDEDADDGEGDIVRYLTNNDVGRFKDASIKELFIDLDAPDDYYIQFNEFKVW